MHLIFKDRFWVLQISPVREDKIKFPAQFQVDHLPHPVASGLIIFLRKFAIIIIIIIIIRGNLIL